MDATKGFLSALSAKTGLPVVKDNQALIESRPGSPSTGGGSWIHPLVAINLGQWLSPEFAVQVGLRLDDRPWHPDVASSAETGDCHCGQCAGLDHLDPRKDGVNSLAMFESGKLTMSSREIAELTGKRHDNVVRDIRAMLIKLHEKVGGGLSFEDTYTDPQNGQIYPVFNLPKRETLILTSGYSVTQPAAISDRLISGHKIKHSPIQF
jgi:Rha family phage regulatory protein